MQLWLMLPTLILAAPTDLSVPADGVEVLPALEVSFTPPGPPCATSPAVTWPLPAARVIFGATYQESAAQMPIAPEELPAGPFAGGRFSFETNAGVYWSQRGLGPRTPTFDFAPLNVRLGLELNDPCLCGSAQALVELSTAPVVDGFGNILVGPTGLLRYNYVRPDWRLVPYLQGGLGFVYTDASYDRTQRAIGQDVEFTIKAALGFHYLLNDHLALNLESGVTHISNADLASRNLGINAVGVSLGFTYYLPWGQQ
jgi:lipid A 3-O-deacylase